ncbi:uncharacterized protein LOC9647718 isoform X1 [Selaginella moellendorffii]|uniref:uncharacterized protein LOC9647718 isoform X1 n=2 Tax=Selaginella moellendorffii TaxID=88036 RepID=UPI000D1CC137|nr:uncharacterized protein LOC9647718 isoform X1 [Selaginella moellendorffii]|eukprot:XP_002980458.2 uncharacterized protein LOC9647718 isoform X1 [Selaginella moellendorffii]
MAARVFCCPCSSSPFCAGNAGRRRASSRRIRALGEIGDGGEDGILRGGMSEELDKLFGDEESKALLRDLSAAARRLDAAKREMENLAGNVAREKDDPELQAQERLVEQCEEDVISAQAELKAAEIALIVARAGGSKWETSDVDEDVERMESGRAALVSAVAGTLASLPLALIGREVTGLVISEALVLVTCAVFGVTYRYIVRRDLGNIQLKSGAAAGFALVRVLGQLESTQVLPGSWTALEYQAVALFVGQSVVMFLAAALALDLCMKLEVIQPFPSRKSV